MEIADVFVVNKADREGADRTVASIEAMLSLQTFAEGVWRPPIVRTEATTGRGVDELLGAIERFRAHTSALQARRRRGRAEYRVKELLADRLVRRVEQQVLQPGELSEIVERIAARELDPYSAVDGIVARAMGARRG
jgi:LAO/AO transport system kinase